MRILTLKQFIQQAGEPQEVLAMPVRELLNERVSPDAPTEDRQRRLITIFEGGMSEFKDELSTWTNNYSVTASTMISGPTIWVKIVGNDDGED